MARRRTTRRKSTARRRRNPKMLVVNPRRRRRSTTKRKTTKRRRRATTKRRATTARRRRRATPKRRRTTAKRRRTNPKRRRARARKKVVVRYRTRRPARRKTKKRRRNPRAKLRLMSSLKKGFAAILPASMAAVFGALSVEPTMWIGQLAAMIPGLNALPASVFYGATGLLSAGAVTAAGFLLQGLLPGLIAASTIKLFATATAAAAGGVGYYKWRTGQDADVASEMGLLTMSGVGPMGLLTAPGMSGVLTLQPGMAGMGDPGAYYVSPTGY